MDPAITSGRPSTAAARITPVAWTLAGMAIAVAAVVLRLYDLELKPLHHDEGVNGHFLRLLVEPPHVYKYDPKNYHGPTLYYFAKAAVDTLGLTTFAVRLVSALAGIATVLLLFVLRRWLGAVGALSAAALIAVSPGAVYLSRYFIHEALLVCFTLGTVVAGWSYVETRRGIHAVTAAFLLGLAFATKETAIISAGVLVIAAILTWTTGGYGLRNLPTLSRLRADATFRPIGRREMNSALLLRRGALAALCFAVFLATIVVFFSSWLTHWTGVSDAAKSLAHWSDTGSQAHRHPWYTYLRWLTNQEASILIGGVLGVLAGLWQAENRFVRFVSLWAIGTLLAYSLIPYKTPWLTLNLVVPLGVCAGYFVDVIVRNGASTARRSVLALTILALGWSTYQTIVLNFFRYDDDRLTYPYAHTSREVLELVRRIDRAREHAPRGTRVTVAVLSPDHFPLSWYLRSYPIGYYGRTVDTRDPICIVSGKQDGDVRGVLEPEYVRSGPYTLRPGIRLVLYIRRDLASE